MGGFALLAVLKKKKKKKIFHIRFGSSMNDGRRNDSFGFESTPMKALGNQLSVLLLEIHFRLFILALSINEVVEYLMDLEPKSADELRVNFSMNAMRHRQIKFEIELESD